MFKGERTDNSQEGLYPPNVKLSSKHLLWALEGLLRNLYAGQEATVRTGHGTTDWFQIGKEYVKAVYCHPAYLTSMQSTS